MISRADVLAQCIAQGKVLRLAVRRELVGVRGEEREGRQVILSVLGEVEVHTPHHVPSGAELPEQLFRRASSLCLSRGERRIDLVPECLEHVCTDIFGTGHCRRAEGERLEIGGVGRRCWRVVRVGAG